MNPGENIMLTGVFCSNKVGTQSETRPYNWAAAVHSGRVYIGAPGGGGGLRHDAHIHFSFRNKSISPRLNPQKNRKENHPLS